MITEGMKIQRGPTKSDSELDKVLLLILRTSDPLPSSPTPHSVSPDHSDSPGPLDPSIHPDPLFLSCNLNF